MNIKKLFTLLTLSLLFGLSPIISNAQSQNTVPEGFELGIRLGDMQGSALTLDAVVPFRGNRLRANVGVLDGFSVAGLHDWKFILNENLFWYPGVGAILDFANGLDVAATGEIGIEYLFSDAPVTISIDWRPTIEFNSRGFQGQGFGINIRYTFQ